MASKEKQYITTRFIKSAAQRAFSEASTQAMEDHGYIIVAKDGYVVKQYKSGKIEKIEKIVQSNISLTLD